MAQKSVDHLIYNSIINYLKILQKNQISVWCLYVFGSHVKGTACAESDIDLAVFWDMDEIDGFDEDVQLMLLTRNVDLRIEPHSFSRRDFFNPNPLVQEIISTGEQIFCSWSSLNVCIPAHTVT